MSDEAILEDDTNEPALLAARFRSGYFFQDGRGFQSPAGPPSGPGSEWLFVFEPMGLLSFRQNRQIQHQVIIPVDVVTNASADAIDVVATASRVHEGGGVDWTVTADMTSDDRITINGRWYLEEQMNSTSSTLGYERSLAEDNATISVSGAAGIDYFENNVPEGFRDGYRSRVALNGNLGASQLLSATTVLSGSYGVTLQTGTLGTTWGSVPLDSGTGRTEEELPQSRLRHAIATELSQIFPATGTTLRASYRYYRDDYDLTAHTARLRLYQYATDWLIFRGSYRFYTQTGVGYFVTSVPDAITADTFRTADSDLAPFDAHELGGKVIWLGPDDVTLDLAYSHYVRTNDLHVDMFAFSLGKGF